MPLVLACVPQLFDPCSSFGADLAALQIIVDLGIPQTQRFFVGKARAVVLQIRRRNLLSGRFWGAEVLQKCRPLTFIQPSQRQNIRGTIAKFGEKPGDVFRGVISANHQ